MNKTKIEWCDFTWNPIKGLCPEACWYCYARAMYRRFKMSTKVELDCRELGAPLALTKKGDQLKTPRGSRIFVCSTMELFNPAVLRLDRDAIFSVIESTPEFTYIILTKRPERIDRPMPSNVWLGVSVTGPGDMWRIGKMFEALASVRFISFEPLLGPCGSFTNHLSGVCREMLQWVIVGRMTGHGHREDPPREWVHAIVSAAKFYRLPVFMKNNLSGIWPGPLIQEYPCPGK
jgi:protein gp37